MIYLIGTYHELQHTGKPRSNPDAVNSDDVEQGRQEFKSYLRDKVQQLSPILIAEEFSEQVLEVLVAESIVKCVADELEIEHKFCDLNTNERRDLGLPEFGTDHQTEEEKAKTNACKEKHWADRISEYSGSPILFVCGADHIGSFGSLLKSRGEDVEIIERNWGKEIYDP